MISLLLDTSNFKLVVAVVDEDKNEVLSYYNEKLNSDLSVKVFEVIKQCIDNANIIPNDIDKIYSITGPGWFTGVRIGVTICKTFAWTLNKKVIPISSLELLASTNTNYELNVAMIDARRDCVYAGVYDNELNTVIEDRYISIEQLLLELKDKNYILISDDDFENLKKIDSKIDILKVINKHKNDVGVNPHSLNPTYLKITEAEAKLQTKNND